MIIKRGAEAELRLKEWMGRKVVEKFRIPKKYRNPILDEELRSNRIKTEARLLREARSLGISVPIVYDINLFENKIVMGYIEGVQVKNLLNSNSQDKESLCLKIGQIIALLHKNDIIHGDLTTSNMLFDSGRIYFIDFSLGEKSSSMEKKGVDLHLLKEAFESAHSTDLHLFDDVLRGYGDYEESEEVIKKVKEIESRGRYT